MSEQKPPQQNNGHTPEQCDPVLVSRTATDYRPHKKDTFEYVGNYQPKYLLVIWAIYFVWATWYMIVHYIPDYNRWFGAKRAELMYGGYAQSYWDEHVEESTVGGYLEKINIEQKLKALEGKSTKKAAKPGAATGAATAPAADTGGGDAGGMTFGGAEVNDTIKATVEPATPEDMKE